MGIADAAESINDEKPLPIPHEIRIANSIEKWGNPYGPWTEWPAGKMYRMQTAQAIWDVYLGGVDYEAGGFAEWIESNPTKVNTYLKIEKLRKKRR